MDTLYDSMVEDMNRADFTVGDKYKAKYDELGKNYSHCAHRCLISYIFLSKSLRFSLPHSLLFDYLDESNTLPY